MDNIINLGNKSYDLDRISEDSFMELYRGAKKIETRLFDKVINFEDTKEDINTLKEIRKIVNKLEEFAKNKWLRDVYIENLFVIPQDEIDVKFNDSLKNMNQAYENTQKEIEKRFDDTEKIENELIDNKEKYVLRNGSTDKDIKNDIFGKEELEINKGKDNISYKDIFENIEMSINKSDNSVSYNDVFEGENILVNKDNGLNYKDVFGNGDIVTEKRDIDATISEEEKKRLEEAMYKALLIDMPQKKKTLFGKIIKLGKEQRRNLENMRKAFAKEQVTVKQTGFFAKLLEKLRPKKLNEKKVYKDKENKLTEIRKKIKSKVEDSNRIVENKNRILRKAKGLAAGFIAILATASSVPLEMNAQDNTINNESNTSYVMENDRNDVDFSEISEVADVKANVDSDGKITFEATVNDEKIDQAVNNDIMMEDAAEQISKISQKDAPLEVRKKIMDIYLNIKSMDISDRDRRIILEEFLKNDSDGISREIKEDTIITAFNMKKEVEERKEQSEVQYDDERYENIDIGAGIIDEEIDILDGYVPELKFSEQLSKEKTKNSKVKDEEVVEELLEDDTDQMIDDTNSDKQLEYDNIIDESEDDEKVEELLEDDTDQMIDDTNSNKVTASKAKEQSKKENNEKQVKENKQEKTAYENIIDINKIVDSIFASTPYSQLEYTLNNDFGNVLSSAEISSVVSSSNDMNQVKKELKKLILNKYLSVNEKEQMPDVYQEDIKKIDAIFAEMHLEGSSLRSTLISNLTTIGEAEIYDIFSNPELSREEYKALVRNAVDYSYRVSKLEGKAKEVYKIVDAIDKTDTHGASKRDLFRSNLEKYFSTGVIDDIFNQVYNTENEYVYQERTESTNNVSQSPINQKIIYTDRTGNDYIIENGSLIQVDAKSYGSDYGYVYVEDINSVINSYSQNSIKEETKETVETKKIDKDKQFANILKEMAFSMNDKEKSQSYEGIEKILYSSKSAPQPDRDSIFKNHVENIQNYSEMVKEGIIDQNELDAIIYGTDADYIKADKVSKIIDEATEEYSADENTKAIYKKIKELVNTHDTGKIQGIIDLIPNQAMQNVGIDVKSDIEDIINDPDMTSKEKEKAIRKVIKDGNEILDKLGYNNISKEELVKKLGEKVQSFIDEYMDR